MAGEVMRVAKPNEVYISGIVHDIGTTILCQYFQQARGAVSSLVYDKKVSRPGGAAEREVLSVDHGDYRMLREDVSLPVMK